MGPAYRLVTPRLLLRCFTPADSVEFRDLIERSRAEVGPYVPLPPADESLETMVQRLRGFRAWFDGDREFVYAVRLRATGELIGAGSLETYEAPDLWTVGLWRRPDISDKGLGVELAGALVRSGFEIMQLPRLVMHIEPANVAMAKVAQRLGFHTDGALRALDFSPGVPRDQQTWALTAAEYASSGAPKPAVQAFDAIDRRII